MSDDWKKDTPFPKHWLFYVVVKVGIVILAVVLAYYLLKSQGYV